MEEYTLEKQSFYALFGSTKTLRRSTISYRTTSPLGAAIAKRQVTGQPNQVYLLKQKDGSVYLGLAGDYEEDGSELFCIGFPLERTGQSDLRLDGRLCRRVRGRPQKRHDDLFRVGKQRLCVPLDRRHGRRRARDAAGAGRFARQPLPRRHGAGAVVLPV